MEWVADKDNPDGPRTRTMLMRVVLDDGTGAMAADLTSGCVERIRGEMITVEKFAAMSEDDQAAQSDLLRQFLLAFLGRAV